LPESLKTAVAPKADRQQVARRPQGTWFAGFWSQPRKTWVRRALFQVHLWSGISVGLIATVVGISGSAIVYKDALDRVITPERFRTAPGSRLSADTLLASAARMHPDWTMTYAAVGPSSNGLNSPWVLYFENPARPGSELTLVYIDPATGANLGETGEASGLMNWLADLHFRLLGGTTGMLVNGIGAWLLLVLCITGLFIWWPGRRQVRRALTIHTGVRWLRLNWDIHNVFGFWSAIPLGIEAFTGAYYCFFVPMAAALVLLLGGSSQRWQEMSVPPRSTPIAGRAPAAMEPLIVASLHLHPDCTLRGLSLPIAAADPFTVQLDPPHAEDRGDYAQVAFDRFSGHVLSDMDSRQESFAIRVVNFIRPLHFGTFAGIWSRVAWILVGFVPGILFFTGFIMWWRRVPARILRNAAKP
jgi:uncharacterized iron-regulated membrane protein